MDAEPELTPPAEIGPHRLYLGDAVRVLRSLPDDHFDLVATDPPYSSGGMFRGDRAQNVAAKYMSSDTAFKGADFAGDNRDQRSWAYWCHLWLSECLRVSKPGGYLLVFTDWRQLPTATDVVQAAGWVWRGLIAWDKGAGSRAPAPHYFRHQCEYLVWASRGAIRDTPGWPPEGTGCYPGCYHYPVVQTDKHHVTGKPTQLMADLIYCVPPGANVLDPFAGSGTTGAAAAREGRVFTGIETDPAHHATALKRIRAAEDRRGTQFY